MADMATGFGEDGSKWGTRWRMGGFSVGHDYIAMSLGRAKPNELSAIPGGTPWVLVMSGEG